MYGKCSECKFAKKKERYCNKWHYARCQSFDFCHYFEEDTKLNIIIRQIWWFNPVKSKLTKDDRSPETYAGLREMQGYEV